LFFFSYSKENDSLAKIGFSHHKKPRRHIGAVDEDGQVEISSTGAIATPLSTTNPLFRQLHSKKFDVVFATAHLHTEESVDKDEKCIDDYIRQARNGKQRFSFTEEIIMQTLFSQIKKLWGIQTMWKFKGIN